MATLSRDEAWLTQYFAEHPTLRPIPGSEPRGSTAHVVVHHRPGCCVLEPAVTLDMLPLELELAIELHAKGNKETMHRFAAARRNKAQRHGVYHALRQYGSAHLLTGPLTITITRIAPGLLGKSNPVIAAAKHVVDGIADWLMSKPDKGHYYDDLPRFTWHTQQEKAGPGIYAVHIRIEETPCP